MENLKIKLVSLLRSSEKYTKTDMVYLTKNSFWLTGGQIISSAVSFGMAIAFANLVDQKTYGIYKYIFSLVAIFSSFSLTGIGTALLQSIATGFDKTLKLAFKKTLIWSFPMILLTISGAIYYFLQDNFGIAISLIIIATLQPFIKSFELYGAFLKGKKDFSKGALFGAITDVITSAFILTTIFFTNNVVLMILSFFTSSFLINGLFYKHILKKINTVSGIDTESISYSKHLSLINILSNISSQIDKVIIFHFLGAAQVAVYTFATAAPKQIRGFLSIASTIALPKLATKPAKEMLVSVRNSFWVSLSILIPIVTIYILAAPYLFKIFFPQYMEAVNYSRIYILFLLLMGNMSELGLTALKAIKQKYIINISSSILNIILMLVLSYFYGIWGIIFSILITKLATAIISYVLLIKLKTQNEQ